MHRWSVCPGSVRLSEGIPSKSSKYAEEGTMAHELAAKILLQQPFQMAVTEEMLENVKVYTDFVLKEAFSDGDMAELLVEHRFDLSNIYPGCFGTADAVIYHKRIKLLQVIDLKFGSGIAVEVEENEQLMFYALGALNSTGYPCETVEIIIVQPRCFHPNGPIRRWSFPATRMIDFAYDVAEFASRTENVNAPLIAGEHCRFCPAAGICPELQKKALEVAKTEFRSDLSYDPVVLAKVLKWLPVLESWVKNVREFAYGEAEHGRCPPGWKLVQKRPTRRWKGDVSAATLQTKFKLAYGSVTDSSIKSPAQIEKLLTKEQKAELAELTESSSSGFTLAPAEDKRPPARMDAKAEFTVIGEE